MGVTATASDFGTQHVVGPVFMFGNAGGVERGGETGPAATGVELVGGGKQRLAATDAAVGALVVAIPVFASEGAFGTFFARNLKLKLGQLCLPFSNRFVNRRGGWAAHGAHYNRDDANSDSNDSGKF